MSYNLRNLKHKNGKFFTVSVVTYHGSIDSSSFSIIEKKGFPGIGLCKNDDGIGKKRPHGHHWKA